jgi:hypothetical protein
MVRWTISFAYGEPLLTLRRAQGEDILMLSLSKHEGVKV